MSGWWLTMAAVSALVAAVPTGREILTAVRARRLARLV
jgi:hypothetical protein